MDITFTREFDAKRYERLMRQALALAAVRVTVACWCFLTGGIIFLLSMWISGERSEGLAFIGSFSIFFPVLIWLIRRIGARQHVKMAARMMGGETSSHCHLTDGGYEVTCGEMSQKMPWQNLGTHYHFFKDVVVLLMQSGAPSLVLDDLRKDGVDKAELEAVLRKAGLKTLRESKKRKVRLVVSCVVGAFFLVCSVSYLVRSVESCRHNMRMQDAKVRLFDLIHGKDDARCPKADDSLRAKVVRVLAGDDEPDEFIYLFDTKDEDGKVGLIARYGNRSYRTYLPCGCTVCSSIVSVYEHGEAKAPTEEWYAEADKEKWLEKVRPIARELYEEVDCDDE